MNKKIQDVQKQLAAMQMDGWLLYDFRRSNDLVHDFLGIDKQTHLTRRFLYWIPAKGEPVQIVHQIESHVLEHLPGKKTLYLKWQTFEAVLKETLQGAKKIIMEYSPRNAIPYLSKVDAGMLDLVRACGIEVFSSGPLLQTYTCVWDQEQLQSHFLAAKVLDEAAEEAWSWIADHLRTDQTITEYDVQQRILQSITQRGCSMDGAPICAVGPHSADPHYAPQKIGSSILKKGDFILIDLWCKQDVPRAVYADITRVAVAAAQPTSEQEAIFQIVRKAQLVATQFVQEGLRHGAVVRGCDADKACRKVIEEAGYGDFFIHRTGHNIHTETHGPGAHLDSLETFDDRPLISRTCFSIEPGIYLPKAFGVRLEYDVFIHEDRSIQITGGIQECIKTLF